MSASACGGRRGVDDVAFSGATLLAARSGGHRLRVAGSASFDAPFWNALRRRPCPSILYTPGDHRRQHCCINTRNPPPTIYLTCIPLFQLSIRQARRSRPGRPATAHSPVTLNNPIPNNPANLLPNTPIPCPSRPQGDTGTTGQASLATAVNDRPTNTQRGMNTIPQGRENMESLWWQGRRGRWVAPEWPGDCRWYPPPLGTLRFRHVNACR